ncbi:hypothetical protein K2173_018731 [Erythroxylum novogranatense]|uniref:CCR4-NOT transcription complex subunit 9 n=1 Tax=Erythroxylum novogranatense TaxID=1862640 RepID=A0AAV8SAV0_9ROSI|nr:hypothetical protein K2173_018731 [Erythroxylum novogranatense]
MSTSWQTPSIAGLDFSPYSNQLIQYLLRLIKALHSAQTQELALALLAKNQEIRGELAPLLWHSVGTMTVLLQVKEQSMHPLIVPDINLCIYKKLKSS